MEQQDLLQDIELDAYRERATVGMRFVNGLLDGIIQGIIDNVFTFLIAFLGFNITTTIVDDTDVWVTFGGTYASGLLLNFFYYTILEGSTKGLTIGKLATGTRAVMADGSFITWQTAALRSLCRLVPFELLSTFGGNPWHDKWTNTKVVKVRRR